MYQMTKGSIDVRRLPIRLMPDSRRTITRFFWPGEERAKKIVKRIKRLSPDKVSVLLKDLLNQFTPNKPGLEEILIENYGIAAEHIDLLDENDSDVRMLIGAYFSMEYAFESAALFNPSMVPAYDQSNVPNGSLAFIMSLRAVGEGHISSIVFRRGSIDAEGNIKIHPATLRVRPFKRERDRKFKKAAAQDELDNLAIKNEFTEALLSELPDTFSFAMLEGTIERLAPKYENLKSYDKISSLLRMVAETEYEISVNQPFDLEDMVLFPISTSESHGMEDMRLVRFEEEDGTVRYYGTYTAYNGRDIVPQVLEVSPEEYAIVRIMWGKFAKNKGMAFFPRRIDGQYALIGRIDNGNLFLLKSDSIHTWDNAKRIIEPKYEWEFVQMGNCGSPLLTEEGWLLLTHGVGPMRKYCIGAVLLDLNDPSKVVARLKEPLMSPLEEERSGYVPNVVYSCGGLIHRDMLVIPYGISDMAAGFAIVKLEELMSKLE
jgi:predicted GH43/DUF377 family glycosyl hydrolase